MPRRLVTDKVKERILEMNGENVKPEQIAETLNLGKSTVRNYLTKANAGLKPRKGGRPKKATAEPTPQPQMDEPETYAAAADSPVIAAQEMVTFPRLVTAFDDLPLQPGSTRRPYAPPAIIREGSLKPVVTPEISTMRVNALEHLPRLADFLRDLRGVEGIRIAGSVSIALSIEAEL